MLNYYVLTGQKGYEVRCVCCELRTAYALVAAFCTQDQADAYAALLNDRYRSAELFTPHERRIRTSAFYPNPEITKEDVGVL